jgi:hypothetical protein
MSPKGVMVTIRGGGGVLLSKKINTGGKTRSNILTIREYEQMLEELFAMPPEEQPLEAEEGPDGAADDAC